MVEYGVDTGGEVVEYARDVGQDVVGVLEGLRGLEPRHAPNRN